MFRKSLATAAALIVALSGGLGGRLAGPAHAHVSAANFSGTVVFTEDVFPDSTTVGGNNGNTTTDGEIAAPLLDQLLGLDNTAHYYADLATEVPSTANGGIKIVNGNEVVTYHLKPNLKWSDGSPITTDDFMLILLLDFAPEFNSIVGYDHLLSQTASGNDIIQTWKGIFGPALSYQPSVLPVAYMEKKYGATIPADLVSHFDTAKMTAYFASAAYKGSATQKFVNAWVADSYISPSDVFDGPYKLQSWTQDQRVVEVANPYYSAMPADPSHPRPATIQFTILTLSLTAYPLDLTADSSYNTVDLAEGGRIVDLPTLQKSKFKVLVKPALQTSFYAFNVTDPFLSDVRVRQALQYGFDRATYIRLLYVGVDPSITAKLALPAFIPATSPYSAAGALPANDYNPAKAKALLAAAGYATSLGGPGKHLTLTITTSPSKTTIRGTQLLQRMWAQIGVSIKIKFIPFAGPNGLVGSYADGGVIYRRTFQIVALGQSAPIDPDSFFANIDPKDIPDATHPFGQNFSGINDPALVSLFNKARGTIDDAQRKKYYIQAQERFYQQAYWIYTVTGPNIALYKGTIGNFKQNPTLASNEWNAFQWYRTTNAQPQ